MKKTIFSLLLLISTSTLFGYDGSPKNQVKSFINDLKDNKTEKAIASLYESNPAMKGKQQSLTVFIQHLNAIKNIHGTFLGSENIYYEELSPSLVRIVELAKYQTHAGIWEFYFYKPKNTWIVSQAYINDKFQFQGRKK